MTKAGEIAEGRIREDFKWFERWPKGVEGQKLRKILGISWVIDTTLDIFKSFDTPQESRKSFHPASLLLSIQRVYENLHPRCGYFGRAWNTEIKDYNNFHLSFVSPRSLTNLFILGRRIVLRISVSRMESILRSCCHESHRRWSILIEQRLIDKVRGGSKMRKMFKWVYIWKRNL